MPVNESQPADPRMNGEQPARSGYAWARPPQQTRWVESEPLEYHRLLRGAPRYRWWKPLALLGLGVIYYFSLSVAFMLVLLVPYFVMNDVPFTQEAMLELALPNTQRPISLVLGLGSVALMIPAVWLAMLSVGLGKTGRIWSVATRVRWRWIGLAVLPAVIALFVINAVSIGAQLLFTGGADSGINSAPEIDWTLALISGVLILLLVPVQSAAEEFVYRGVMMQVLGSWIRSPWPAIVVPSILFGLSHIYDIWGLLSVTAMGLSAAWLTWRTGGLEVAVTLHIVNNWVAFGFMVVGFGGETGQTANGGSLATLLGTVAGLALYTWWMDRMFVKRDGVRTRIDYIEEVVA